MRNVKSILDDEVKQPGRLCGFLYAGGHGSAGRAVAFYLETMLDDGLLPATLTRYFLRTICSSNPVQQEAEILQVGKLDDRCNHSHRLVQWRRGQLC